MTADAELLRRYAETRSERAFSDFVGRHLNLVYFTAVRATAGDTTLAQDIAQTVFTVAARQARTLARHAAVTGWLHTTTRNIAARVMRNERTRQRYEQAAAQDRAMTGDSDSDWERLRPVIDDALQGLSARDRDAILERFFEARSFVEIGESWRISADAARMRVDRALEKLRAALQRRGIQSMTSALALVLTAQGGVAAPIGLAASVSGAAVAACAAPAGVVTFLSLMSATKTMLGAAAVVAALATGAAVFEYGQAREVERRVDAANREVAALRQMLARTEQRKYQAERVAAEAESDSAELLAAVDAARAKNVSSSSVQSSVAKASLPLGHPLAQTLQSIFPDGIVARVGDRAITVEEVVRNVAPQLPALQQRSRSDDELRQRLYGLQNQVIADLVTRQLDVKEFRNRIENVPEKRIAGETVDTVIADVIREQFNNDRNRFSAHLAEQGLTVAQYREGVEENLISSYMRLQQRRLAQSAAVDAKP